MELEQYFPVWSRLTPAGETFRQHGKPHGEKRHRHPQRQHELHRPFADPLRPAPRLYPVRGGLGDHRLPSFRHGYLPVLRLLHDAQHSV